ncbi:MAG: hypothetical protein U1E65_33455 [Myxococcota bacterium]
MTESTARTLATGASLALLVSATACSNAGLVEHYYKQTRPAMVKGDWKVAVAAMEKAKDKPYGEKDRVMYWLNLGTVMHYADQGDASNENLFKAEAAMQELWTTSVTAEASKVIANETAQSYGGEDFEKVLVYVYTALNNAKAGKLSDASTEARRADEFLKKMLVQYDKEGGEGTVYKQDAFILWLVGLFYEMEGSTNDAFITYKAAHEAYKTDYAGTFGMSMPKFLGEDLVRTAKMLGFTDDANTFGTEFGATGETQAKLADSGEVIVIHGNGEAPSKRELFFDGTMPDNYVMRIAIPEFVAVPPRTAYAEISSDGVSAKSEMAEPVTDICLKNFELRLPAIKARALARAIVKYAATKAAQAAGGGSNSTAGALLGLAGNIVAAATEAADMRSWNTLPANFGVGRIWLPPGPHTITVQFKDGSGYEVNKAQTFQVNVEAGKRTILSVRSML